MNRTFLRRFGAALLFPLVASVALAGAAAATVDPDKTPGEVEELRHGSRRKAGDGTLVVYDKVHGLYMVPGRKATFWVGERFYEFQAGIWVGAIELNGPWELIRLQNIPDALAELHKPATTKVTVKLPWGSEAVYEPRLKVYKVIGKPGIFLSDGYFLRYDHGIWLEGKRDEGPWTLTSVRSLPAPLRKAVPIPENGQKVVLPSGESVVFDKRSRLFAVEGKPDTVLFDSSFYERHEDKWFASTKADGGFAEVNLDEVPPLVRAKHKKPGKGGNDKVGKGDKNKVAKGGKVKKAKPARSKDKRAAREPKEKKNSKTRATAGD